MRYILVKFNLLSLNGFAPENLGRNTISSAVPVVFGMQIGQGRRVPTAKPNDPNAILLPGQIQSLTVIDASIKRDQGFAIDKSALACVNSEFIAALPEYDSHPAWHVAAILMRLLSESSPIYIVYKSTVNQKQLMLYFVSDLMCCQGRPYSKHFSIVSASATTRALTRHLEIAYLKQGQHVPKVMDKECPTCPTISA